MYTVKATYVDAPKRVVCLSEFVECTLLSADYHEKKRACFRIDIEDNGEMLASWRRDIAGEWVDVT